MITIPCDYSHPEGRSCESGKVLIYGEMGGRPPETITCPKCNGKGTIEVERADIEEQLADLEEERQEIDSEIERLQGYLE